MTQAELDQNLKLSAQLGTPVEVVDPSTQEVFYLVSAEQYHQFTVARDFDPRMVYPAVDKLMAADDSEDPLLDSYQ